MKSHVLTNRLLIRWFIGLMLPLMATNLLQQLYYTIDTIVIGRYASADAFAAIGIAGSVLNLFLFTIVGACTGVSVLFAQSYGAQNLSAFRREHFLTIAAGLLATAAVSLAGILLLPLIQRLILVPEELWELVRVYLLITLTGLPAAFLYNLYSALLRAAGHPGVVLAALALSTAVHLVLDLWFIQILQLDLVGAALSTVLSQLLAAGLCIFYLFCHTPELLFRREDCRFDRSLLWATARCSFVTALHQSSLYIGKLLVQGAVNSGGAAMIAAYTATTRIEGFANSMGDSGTAATSVIVAQNLGARDRKNADASFRCSFCLLLLIGVFISCMLFFLAPAASKILLGTFSGDAFDSSVQYLRLIAVFYILCYLGGAFVGYFNGLGKVAVSFAGAVCQILLRIVLSWGLIPTLQLNAIAVATGIGWLSMDFLWALQYLRSRMSASS